MRSAIQTRGAGKIRKPRPDPFEELFSALPVIMAGTTRVRKNYLPCSGISYSEQGAVVAFRFGLLAETVTGPDQQGVEFVIKSSVRFQIIHDQFLNLKVAIFFRDNFMP
jgi:hypothetical protein